MLDPGLQVVGCRRRCWLFLDWGRHLLLANGCRRRWRQGPVGRLFAATLMVNFVDGCPVDRPRRDGQALNEGAVSRYVQGVDSNVWWVRRAPVEPAEGSCLRAEPLCVHQIVQNQFRGKIPWPLATNQGHVQGEGPLNFLHVSQREVVVRLRQVGLNTSRRRAPSERLLARMYALSSTMPPAFKCVTS